MRAFLPLLLTALPGLVACQSLTPAPTVAVPAVVMSVPLNPAAPALTVTPLNSTVLSRSPLQAMRLTLVTSSNVVDYSRKMLHVSVTYAVQLPPGAALTRPLYIPLVLSGQTATQDQTPFREVRTRSGQPVAASGLQLEQAQVLSATGVGPDAGAATYTDVQADLQEPALPSGTTLSRSWPQAFEGDSIRAGGSGQITFGARVPLRGADIGDQDAFRFEVILAVHDRPETN